MHVCVCVCTCVCVCVCVCVHMDSAMKNEIAKLRLNFGE